MENPFGLPQSMKLGEYRDDSIFYSSQFNYKLDAKMGLCTKTQKPMLPVLSPVHVQNLIRVYLLPERLFKKLDRSREIVNLENASKHRLGVFRIIPLTVNVATQY